MKPHSPTNVTRSSMLEIWELPQDQMAEATGVLSRKATHDGEAERQSYDRGCLVENLRHGELPFLFEDWKLFIQSFIRASYEHSLEAEGSPTMSRPGIFDVTNLPVVRGVGS